MASGDSLGIWAAESFRIPASAGGFQDLRNGHPCVALTISDNVLIGGVMPQAYAGGGVTVYLHYAMASATSGNVKLEGSFERIGDSQLDIDSDSFATAQNTGDVAVPGTSGHVDITTIGFTNGAQMDSVTTGESFRFKVTRIAAGSSDATGDAQLTAIEIREA